LPEGASKIPFSNGNFRNPDLPWQEGGQKGIHTLKCNPPVSPFTKGDFERGLFTFTKGILGDGKFPLLQGIFENPP